MNESQHVLCCDCDGCLNRGGGTPAAATPTHPTPPDRVPAWRAKPEYAPWELALRARHVDLRAENKTKGLCPCGRERIDKTYVCCELCRLKARRGSRESVTQ